MNATCRVVNKIHYAGHLTGHPEGGALPHYQPDTFCVVVDFEGKRKKMFVKNDYWFQSLCLGEIVEITYTKPWWKFGGITIESMKKV